MPGSARTAAPTCSVASAIAWPVARATGRAAHSSWSFCDVSRVPRRPTGRRVQGAIVGDGLRTRALRAGKSSPARSSIFARLSALTLPSSRVSAALVLMFLAFGVILGGVVGSPVQNTLAASGARHVKLILPSAAPVASTATPEDLLLFAQRTARRGSRTDPVPGRPLDPGQVLLGRFRRPRARAPARAEVPARAGVPAKRPRPRRAARARSCRRSSTCS